jgi:TatD DNase family protein
VESLLCCGSEEKDWADAAALAHADGRIVPAFGLHPWYVRDRTAGWLETLAGFLKAEPRAVVGEIGLDRALKERNDDEQGEVFLAQLRLAREMGRAVSIHCRRAWGQLMQYDADLRALPRGFAIHSYSGARDLIAPLAQAGAFFSFSGTITWSHNVRAHDACRNVPSDRLLIETDAPDLMPAGAEDKPVNEPANLLRVLRKVAELRGASPEAMAELTWRNSNRLFMGREA